MHQALCELAPLGGNEPLHGIEQEGALLDQPGVVRGGGSSAVVAAAMAASAPATSGRSSMLLVVLFCFVGCCPSTEPTPMRTERGTAYSLPIPQWQTVLLRMSPLHGCRGFLFY